MRLRPATRAPQPSAPDTDTHRNTAHSNTASPDHRRMTMTLVHGVEYTA